MNEQFIMESFWQHPDGYNCATTALIKVAILHYGIDKVFKTGRQRSHYTIWLRNGKKLIIDKEQLKRINRGNHFVFSNYGNKKKNAELQKLKTYVRVCYAVMIEYLHQIGYNRKKYTIKNAIEYLQEGFGEDDPFNTDHLYLFLGLKRAGREVIKLKKKHLLKFKEGPPVVMYSPRHVVTAMNGCYDYYGTRKPLKKDKIPKLLGVKAKWWYQLK